MELPVHFFYSFFLNQFRRHLIYIAFCARDGAKHKHNSQKKLSPNGRLYVNIGRAEARPMLAEAEREQRGARPEGAQTIRWPVAHTGLLAEGFWSRGIFISRRTPGGRGAFLSSNPLF